MYANAPWPTSPSRPTGQSGFLTSPLHVFTCSPAHNSVMKDVFTEYTYPILLNRLWSLCRFDLRGGGDRGLGFFVEQIDSLYTQSAQKVRKLNINITSKSKLILVGLMHLTWENWDVISIEKWDSCIQLMYRYSVNRVCIWVSFQVSMNAIKVARFSIGPCRVSFSSQKK